MVIMESGIARGLGVAQHGGHTPNNRLTETCSLGLLCTSLILNIVVTDQLTPVTVDMPK